MNVGIGNRSTEWGEGKNGGRNADNQVDHAMNRGLNVGNQCGNVENVESEGYLVSETACLRQKVSERRIAASAVQTCPVIAQDTIIFNSAITACEKGRQWQASLCLLERLDRPLNGLFSHSRRLPVSIVRNMEIRVLVAGVGISALWESIERDASRCKERTCAVCWVPLQWLAQSRERRVTVYRRVVG